MPVVLPPGCARERAKAFTDHVVGDGNNRDARRRCLGYTGCLGTGGNDGVGAGSDQLQGGGHKLLVSGIPITPIDGEISTFDEPVPAQFVEHRIDWRKPAGERSRSDKCEMPPVQPRAMGGQSQRATGKPMNPAFS